MPAFIPRSPDATPSSGLSLDSENGPIYIAGIVVAGVLFLGICIWLLVRHLRNKARTKREDARQGAFLNVKGLVKENASDEKNPDEGLRMKADVFSRDNMTPSIVMPTAKSDVDPAGIYAHHAANGTMPRAFSSKPFSFALEAAAGGSPRNSVLPTPDALFSRNSFLSSSRNSFMSAGSRFSVISSVSTVSSSGATARKIRQVFSPVLPDELLVQTLGERLTIVQSFDDGWTLVGREGNLGASIPKSLFNTNPVPPNDIELGVIPAWCFIKPCKGLRAERPVRTTSLGVTVQLDAPAGPREEVMSWSNF